MQLIFPGSGAQINLVWENPQPVASFAPQDISVDLTAYKAVIIIYKNLDGTNGTKTSFIFIDSVNREIVSAYSEELKQTFIRPTRVEYTALHFGGSQLIGGSSENNGTLVPQKVYGIQF